MIRQIIHIDEEKCNGCGLCAAACHEGAIDMVEGKAKLVRENFCDGFGDCLPNCPTGAITFENREAPAYDEAAVEAAKKEQEGEHRQEGGNQREHADHDAHDTHDAHIAHTAHDTHAAHVAHAAHSAHTGGCPGARLMQFHRKEESVESTRQSVPQAAGSTRPVSQLHQWPCQIKLLPVQAPFYDGANLLIAADCTAYAYANIHEDFMKGRITLIGCPKLDAVDYTDKLTEIIARNDIKSVTILRMEVPCCGGLQRAAENALRNSGKFIPWQVVTIARDGRVLG